MQQTMRPSRWRPGVAAIVRMSATPANYWAELVLDLALGSALLSQGWRLHRGSSVAVAATLVAGLLAFSLIEYVFHRWLFHARMPLLEQGHSRHHQHPLGYDALPFFLPPAILLALAGMFMALMPTGLALLAAGAISYGYVAYGLAHYAIHHARFRRPLLRQWAAAHHVHHYHPSTNFGVTTPLWDILLGTRYVRRPGPRTRRAGPG